MRVLALAGGDSIVCLGKILFDNVCIPQCLYVLATCFETVGYLLLMVTETRINSCCMAT